MLHNDAYEAMAGNPTKTQPWWKKFAFPSGMLRRVRNDHDDIWSSLGQQLEITIPYTSDKLKVNDLISFTILYPIVRWIITHTNKEKEERKLLLHGIHVCLLLKCFVIIVQKYHDALISCQELHCSKWLCTQIQYMWDYIFAYQQLYGTQCRLDSV